MQYSLVFAVKPTELRKVAFEVQSMYILRFLYVWHDEITESINQTFQHKNNIYSCQYVSLYIHLCSHTFLNIDDLQLSELIGLIGFDLWLQYVWFCQIYILPNPYFK